MFKRLSKSRRHSADDVALSLSGPSTFDDPPGTQTTSQDISQISNTAALLRVSRTKCIRRSCGDAASVQPLFSPKEQDQEQDSVDDADYQMVTAVPAFIVEHESEKKGSGIGIWGRRMSKKIDSFRRAGSRETICTADKIDVSTGNNINNNISMSNNNNDRRSNNNKNKNNDNDNDGNCINNNNDDSIHLKAEKSTLDRKADVKLDRRLPGSSHRSPSPFKSFFIRMGSTGMLNSTRMNRCSQNMEDRRKSTEKENLFRSCSTSQLNTSPTYVKGDDPSEGIDLQIGARKDKTVSCDDLASRQGDDVFDECDADIASLPSICSTGLGSISNNFNSYDFAQPRSEGSPMRKSNSCDFKESKKSSFPYAFLRSKLSVLPEERYGGGFVAKDDRLFKTTSEEHFPALKIEESYGGTSTLGRRRSRTGNLGRGHSAKLQDSASSKPVRSSYAEFRRANAREQDRYSLSPYPLERIEDKFQPEDGRCCSPYDGRCCSPMLIRSNSTIRRSDSNSQDRADFGESIIEARYPESMSINVDLDVVASLRTHRRNSAPSGEQRLSSHYVSSNESGYDSDGPRGESAAASENEGISLKCTDSSDTSSVIDSELEKPMRSSTPSEYQEHEMSNQESLTQKNSDSIGTANSGGNDGLDGLRWHQCSSGRMLPSIHQSGFDAPINVSSNPQCSIPRDGLIDLTKLVDVSPHRIRLQQDKTRFLSDIIQPPKRVRRCRMVQLHKRDPRESLGIRLAQQRFDQLRYVVVQLESDGIAHRDGRLRLGDEIVEVEGKELRTLESLGEVQEFLRSFTGNRVRLMTAYEETVPQVYVNPPSLASREYEYLENAKNLSNMSLIHISQTQTSSAEKASLVKNSSSLEAELSQAKKRPNFLPLSCLTKLCKDPENNVESLTESQHHTTKHIAKFEKGCGKPSLGFSVVGGRDSPRGEMGIFVRRVFPGGQADVSKSLFQGDEIVSLNGKVLRGYTHQEVIELFKAVREGPVELEVTRRHRYSKSGLKSAPC